MLFSGFLLHLVRESGGLIIENYFVCSLWSSRQQQGKRVGNTGEWFKPY